MLFPAATALDAGRVKVDVIADASIPSIVPALFIAKLKSIPFAEPCKPLWMHHRIQHEYH
jgi:hypothetical protein